MKLSNLLFGASLALAAPAPVEKSPLDVQIEQQGNSVVKATITNLGDTSIKVLKTGTFLDTKEVEKASVFSGESRVKFEGVRIYLDYNNLPDTAFLNLTAGESIERTFDVAELHNLSDGGDFTIEVSGALQYAQETSNKISGSIAYNSNTLSAKINGAEASSTFSTFHARRAAKRATVSSTCTGSKLSAAKTALSNCASSAKKAASAARTGGTKLTEYFKSDSSSTRSAVAAVYDKIASECGSTNSGGITFECDDVSNYCDGAVAYADLGIETAVFCESYWDFAALGQCHDGDQAGIVIHEFSHMSSIKGTDDYGGYGYEFVKSLTAAQNLNHADTYMLYANAIRVGC